MKKLVILLIILSIVAVGIFVYQIRSEKEEEGPLVPTAVPISLPSQESTPAISPRPAIVSKNIIVSSPANNQSVSGSFTISGEARVFENVVSIRVTDQITEKILTQTTAYANSADVGQFGPFALRFDIPQGVQPGSTLLIEVYQASAKDGSEIDKITRVVLVK